LLVFIGRLAEQSDCSKLRDFDPLVMPASLEQCRCSHFQTFASAVDVCSVGKDSGMPSFIIRHLTRTDRETIARIRVRHVL
jgi:hypothetical protein